MYIDGPWDMIIDLSSVKSGIENFKVGIAPLPVGPGGKSVSILAGSGFGISPDLYKNHPGMNKSVLLSDAIKAIEGLTSPTAEQFLASEGRAFSARTAQQKYWFTTVEGTGCGQRHCEHGRRPAELRGATSPPTSGTGPPTLSTARSSA